MDFEKRLQKAIERGQRQSESERSGAVSGQMTEEELRRLHGQHQVRLSEYIEECLKKVADHFPGFRYESVLDERGWGAALLRDDFARGQAGGRQSVFSRLEMVVRPYGPHHVLDVAVKGTVRNKELLNRSTYVPLASAVLDKFTDQIDNWALEYAELYARS